VSDVTYAYVPLDWDLVRFQELGGFVVVFLNYNKMAQIRESVASALAQDFPLCEMFFMDDRSTDGSAEVMEEMVRAYRGRHKVTLVRKATNGGIVGQWNTVARLAQGEWFGMFCGDDVAFPDRVTTAARLIKPYPHLKGLCTMAIVVDETDGQGKGLKGCCDAFSTEVYAMSGQVDLREVNDERHPIVGATAFWHRSLFADPLPSVPLDDVLLRWIVQLMFWDSPEVGFLWDGKNATIRYSEGCGITSVPLAKGTSPLQRARDTLKRKRYYGDLHARTWRGIRDYYKAHAAHARLRAFADYSLLINEIAAGGTLHRLALFPFLVRSCFRRGMSPSWAIEVIVFWFVKTAREFFGLTPPAALKVLKQTMRKDSSAR